jgi:hypothetical protein
MVDRGTTASSCSLPPLEGWAYRADESAARKAISTAIAPSERGAQWEPLSDECPLSRKETFKLLFDAYAGADHGLVLTFSHDDYLNNVGGVQNCIGDEQISLQAEGWAFAQFSPNSPKPALAVESSLSQSFLLANVNGKRAGLVVMSDVLWAVRELRKSSTELRCIVHHLMGYAPEHLSLVAQACGDHTKTFVWIHDLFSLCPTFTLLRNEAQFCHAPALTSAACGICHAGPDRADHVRRVRNFFDATVPVILAPSQTILDFWRSHQGYQHTEAHVVPPCTIEFQCDAPAFQMQRPLKVAFIGAPMYHKGWHVFEALARWHANDQRYEFYHLGWHDAQVPGIKFIKTGVSNKDRSAMLHAMTRASIDVSINWSLCYESFSFTTHEALAAGAYVIARKDAGHVGKVLSREYAESGLLLTSDIELSALFADGEIRKRVSKSRRRFGTLHYGRGTTPVLMRETGCA